MDATWIHSLHNLHCPKCDSRLVQLAGRHFHSQLGSPVYVGQVGTLSCPQGHPLPDRRELYEYRARHGYAVAASVSEVVPPVR
jgi:hypothetical protein